MAKGLSAAKAKKILTDGYVKGKPLTAKQRKYFGAIASGATPLKAIDGADIEKAQLGKILKWGKDIYKGAKKFNSTIDWAKWNKEIPTNNALMTEYNAIEGATKKNGTWMKNSDGSAFKGSPEQFVQQNSENFKRAYPDGFKEGYRGGKQHVDDFVNRDRNDWATFLTDNKKNAESYATSDGLNKEFFNPAVNKPGEWVDGIYQLAFPSNLPTVTGNANNRSWRLLNYDNRIEQGLTNNNVNVHNTNLRNIPANEIEGYNIQGFNPSNKYLSTDDYASYVKNTNNPEAIAEIKNVRDQMGFSTDIPTNTVYAVDAERVPLKSLLYNNGMFDMTNPNIYKAIVPGAIGAGAASQMTGPIQEGGQFKNGGWLDKYESGGEVPKAQIGKILKWGKKAYENSPLLLNAAKNYPSHNYDKVVNETANLLRRKGVKDPFEVADAIGLYTDKSVIPNNVFRGVKIPIDDTGLSQLNNKRSMVYTDVHPENIMTNNEGMLKMQEYAVGQNLKRLQGIDKNIIGSSDYLHSGAWTSNKQGAMEYGNTGKGIYDDPIFPGELQIRRKISQEAGDHPQGMLQEFLVNKDKPLFGVDRQAMDNVADLISKKLNKPVNEITLKESEETLRSFGIDYFKGGGFRNVPEYHFMPGKMKPTNSKFIYKNGGWLDKYESSSEVPKAQVGKWLKGMKNLYKGDDSVKIINKLGLDISNLGGTSKDVKAVAKKIKNRLMTDKFITNNMNATGRSRKEVLESIENFTSEFNKGSVTFDDFGTSLDGIYRGVGDIGINTNNLNFKVSNNNNVVTTSTLKASDDIVGTIDHEVNHLFSDSKGPYMIIDNKLHKQPLYDNYPNLKLTTDPGANIPGSLLYQSVAPEQQVRQRKAIAWLEENAGLEMGGDITEEMVEKLGKGLKEGEIKFAKRNQGGKWTGPPEEGGTFEYKFLQGDYLGGIKGGGQLQKGKYSDVGGLLNNLDAAPTGNKDWVKAVTNTLNKTYGVIPAAGVIGAASQMGPKQQDGQFKNGGWLDKYQMGGSLPGASGMMYGRTSGNTPMEPGKLKKAQTGVNDIKPVVDQSIIPGFEKFLFNTRDDGGVNQIKTKNLQTQFDQFNTAAGGSCVAGSLNCNTGYITPSLPDLTPVRTLIEDREKENPNLLEKYKIKDRVNTANPFIPNNSIDGWEIHELLRGEGLGTAFFTASDNTEWNGQLPKDLDLTTVPLGAIIGQGASEGTYTKSEDNEEGQPKRNRHGLTVVGYDFDGMPMVYDSGSLQRLDFLDSLVNDKHKVTRITVPKGYEKYTYKYMNDQNTKKIKDLGYKESSTTLQGDVSLNSDWEPIQQIEEAANYYSPTIALDYDVPKDTMEMFVKLLPGLSAKETKLNNKDGFSLEVAAADNAIVDALKFIPKIGGELLDQQLRPLRTISNILSGNSNNTFKNLTQTEIDAYKEFNGDMSKVREAVNSQREINDSLPKTSIDLDKLSQTFDSSVGAFRIKDFPEYVTDRFAIKKSDLFGTSVTAEQEFKKGTAAALSYLAEKYQEAKGLYKDKNLTEEQLVDLSIVGYNNQTNFKNPEFVDYYIKNKDLKNNYLERVKEYNYNDARIIDGKEYPDWESFREAKIEKEKGVNEQNRIAKLQSVPKSKNGTSLTGGWLDKYESDNLPKAQNGIKEAINKYLGDPDIKAREFAENPDELSNIDNMRHAQAARLTQEAIANKTGNIPLISDTLGFLGSNALGVGHELSTLFGDKDKRDWSTKLQESGEDIFNNLFGSVVGALPMDDKTKDDVIKYTSYNNMLPDGYVREEQGEENGFSENVYFKNKDGEIRRPEYKTGGSLPKAQLGIKLSDEELAKRYYAEQPTLSTYEEPSMYEKAMDYLGSPMTTLGYLARGEDLPDKIPMYSEERSAFDDFAFDLINPIAYGNYARDAVRDAGKENYLDAGLNALSSTPVLPSVMKYMPKNVKNIFKKTPKVVDDIVKPKAIDLETTPLRNAVTQPNIYPTSSPLPKRMEPYLSQREIPISKKEELLQSTFDWNDPKKLKHYNDELESRLIRYNQKGEVIPNMKQGGVIKDDRGQWAHPGEVTEISGNTMATHGYGDNPLYVVPDVGEPRIVEANTGTQTFPGATKFTEYPMAKNGSSLVELNQLTNFTNYNTPQPGGWLDKYN
jgi:hypothetical protein